MVRVTVRNGFGMVYSSQTTVIIYEQCRPTKLQTDNFVIGTPVMQLHHNIIFIREVFSNVADTAQMCSFILMVY